MEVATCSRHSERFSSEPNFDAYLSPSSGKDASNQDNLQGELAERVAQTNSDIIFQEQSAGSPGSNMVVLVAASQEKLMDWLLLSEG